jgi:hypothetical protein
MNRLVLIVCLFSAGFALPACQSYTTTLVESPGRVDERVAISTLRSIAQAQTAYSLTHSGAYGSFEQLIADGHLDSRFSSGQPKVGGYVLSMTVSNPSSGVDNSYHCNADPDPSVKAAGRHFYLGSNSSELRMNATKPATASDEAFRP